MDINLASNKTKLSKKKLGVLLSLSAVMFSTYVGPGFASGTQTVSYFLTKGWIGVFLGPIIAGLLCFVFTFLLFEINRIYKPNNYREAYDQIYRKKGLKLFFGTFKETQVLVSTFIALSAQIATSAALLNTVYGINITIGTVLFIVIILVFALRGAKLIRDASSAFSICIIAICIYIGIKCIGAATPGMLNFVNTRVSYTASGITSGPFAWFTMLMIVVFFMNGYEACIPASKGIITSSRDSFIVALTTAILSGGSTMIFTIIFAAGMPGLEKVTIPTLWAITQLTPSNIFVKTIYVLFAMFAMIGSSMAFIFTVSERFNKPLAKVWKGSTESNRKLLIALFFVFICTFGSFFGLLKIIKYGYGTFTMIVGPVMFIPLIVSVPYRIFRDKKDRIIDVNCNLIEKQSDI